MRHVISVLMQNEPGALTRLTGLFSTRGYNIESLNVAPTENPLVSRLTLVTRGSDAAIEQVTKQVSKLIDVVDLHDMTLGDHFERELVLLKLGDCGSRVQDLHDICQRSGARVLDDNANAFTIEYAASTAEVDAFIASLSDVSPIGALVRSGSLGISHGERVLEAESFAPGSQTGE